MKTFDNLKIGVKLTGGFLLVGLVFAIVAGVGLIKVSLINTDMSVQKNSRTPCISRAET